MSTKILLSIARRIYKSFERIRIKQHRLYVLSQIKGGDNLHLDGIINVIVPEKLLLGKNVYIGANSYFNCMGGIAIGDNTILSRNVTIYSYNHNFKCPKKLPYDSELILEPVSIGNYAWVGMNATIAPGTVIGDGSIIGIGAVVSGSIPQNAIVVNSKPRIVGFRDPDLTKDLADQGSFFRVDNCND